MPLGWWLVARAQEPIATSPLAQGKGAVTDLAVRFDRVGPQPGDRLPDVPLRTLDDKPFSLGELRGWSNVLLVTSSLTCPKSRTRWPDLKQIADQYPDLHVLLVYVIEAHPVGDMCPYKGVEDVTPENREEGILHRQPTTMKQRLQLAGEFHRRMGIDDKKVQVYVDTMDNLAWTALGAAPNLALLVGHDGKVAYRQGWFKAAELEPRIKQMLEPETRTSRTGHRDGNDRTFNTGDLSSIGGSIYKAYDIVLGDEEAAADKLLSDAPELLTYAPSIMRMHDPRGDHTLLMQAAERGLLKPAELLLRHGADVNAQPGRIASSLHLAAKAGNLDMVKLLIANKADVNLPSLVGSITPLDEAAMHDKTDVAKELIAAGAKHDFFTQVGLGDVGAVREALAADPARALVPDGGSRTPLTYAAATGQTKIARILLEAKAIPTNPDRTNDHPLLWAARNNHPQMADLLISAGASPDSKAHEEGTALHIAVAGGHAEMIDVLLGHKANTELLDWPSLTPLHRAVLKGNTTIARQLLEGHANPSSQQQKYATPCGKSDYAPATLDTPLHFAAEEFDRHMVAALLAGGADVNAENAAGITPLGKLAGVGEHQYSKKLEPADIERRLETVRVLLVGGARPDGPAEHGGRVKDFLRETGDAEILKSLEK